MPYIKKILSALFPALILSLLLSHPRLSADGAQKGLLLWFNTVFPTLFPFMLFSKLLAEHGGVQLLLAPFHPVLKHLGMSVYSGYALLAGLLCGYPMGMKTAADFNRKSLLSAHEKRLLTAISASPSPMFIAGYAAPRLNPAVPSNYLVLALYTPLLLVGSLLCIYNKVTSFSLQNRFFSKETGSVKPARTKSTSVSVPASFDTILMDCIELQVRIGGLIMLYSILAAFADAFCSGTLRLFLIGTAEMTTGIDAIARSGSIFSIPVQSGAMAACAAFGGLSGIAPDKFSHTGQPKRQRKKCRTFHPALCTVETGSRQSLVRSLYSAASPDAACVAAAAASAPVFSSGSVTTLPASSLRLEDTTS